MSALEALKSTLTLFDNGRWAKHAMASMDAKRRLGFCAIGGLRATTTWSLPELTRLSKDARGIVAERVGTNDIVDYGSDYEQALRDLVMTLFPSWYAMHLLKDRIPTVGELENTIIPWNDESEIVDEVAYGFERAIYDLTRREQLLDRQLSAELAELGEERELIPA